MNAFEKEYQTNLNKFPTEFQKEFRASLGMLQEGGSQKALGALLLSSACLEGNRKLLAGLCLGEKGSNTVLTAIGKTLAAEIRLILIHQTAHTLSCLRPDLDWSEETIMRKTSQEQALLLVFEEQRQHLAEVFALEQLKRLESNL